MNAGTAPVRDAAQDSVSSLRVRINGSVHTLEEPTIAAALAALGVPANAKHVAVAVNDMVIPRARWHEVSIATDDAIEIITAVAGG